MAHDFPFPELGTDEGMPSECPVLCLDCLRGYMVRLMTDQDAVEGGPVVTFCAFCGSKDIECRE